MLLCFLQAHGSHNITPKLCLHMVPVINDGDLRTIFLEQPVKGCVHIHGHRF